jgi:hypothetical protein
VLKMRRHRTPEITPKESDSMWSISVLDNNVKVSKKAARELSAIDSYRWGSVKEVVDEKGILIFNSDHMEHMDFLHEDSVVEVLCKNKAKGRATFGSLDGDNCGQFWGYEFDGKGGMRRLRGSLTWEPAPDDDEG